MQKMSMHEPYRSIVHIVCVTIKKRVVNVRTMYEIYKSCRLVGRSVAWWEGLAANWWDANATVQRLKLFSHFGFILSCTDAPFSLLGMYRYTRQTYNVPGKRLIYLLTHHAYYVIFCHWRTHSTNVTVRMSVHNSFTREKIVCELYSTRAESIRVRRIYPTQIRNILFRCHLVSGSCIRRDTIPFECVTHPIRPVALATRNLMSFVSVTWLNAKVAFDSFIHLPAVSIRIDFSLPPSTSRRVNFRRRLLSHIVLFGLINFYFISVVVELDKVVCSVRSIAWRTPTIPHIHSFDFAKEEDIFFSFGIHVKRGVDFKRRNRYFFPNTPHPNTHAPICFASYVIPINALFSASIGCVFGSVAV